MIKLKYDNFITYYCENLRCVVGYEDTNTSEIVTENIDIFIDNQLENKKIILGNTKDNDLNISEGVLYHLKNGFDLSSTIYRYGSDSFFNIINEFRYLKENKIHYNPNDKVILETDLGRYGLYEDKLVPLDFVFINEAEYQGKEVELNKPKRGGSKAYYVYVRNPKTKKIIKVSFGSGGLRAKIKDPEARKRFASRHNCKDKKDRTTPGYWSCNLPRYASVLGLGDNMNTYW